MIISQLFDQNIVKTLAREGELILLILFFMYEFYIILCMSSI